MNVLWNCNEFLTETKVASKIFEPKGDEVDGQFNISHNEKLRDLYQSPSILRRVKSGRLRWAEYSSDVDTRNACRILDGKPFEMQIL
jgi:hypothetical protein